MKIVLIKVSGSLHDKIVESGGRLLNRITLGGQREEGFDRKKDVYAGLDYRDVSFLAEDEGHALYRLFRGDPLVEGYEWTYGPPAFFDQPTTRELRRLLEESDDGWPLSEVVDFMSRAVEEGKGIVVGVS